MSVLVLALICALPSSWASISSCHLSNTASSCEAAACGWCGEHCWPKANACPLNATHATAFNSFQADHSRSYADAAEHAMRFDAFQDSLKIFARLNEDEQGTAEYGLTRWSDRSAEEKSLKCGSARKTGRYLKERNTHPLIGNGGSSHLWDGTCYAGKRFPDMCKGPLPTSVDWVALGAVSPVQDQGKCGNCFTFGATCDFESAWFLAGNPLVKLSEQQITSCDKNGDDGGCGGGSTNLDTDEWVSKNGGIASEAAYPYCSGKYNCKGDSKKQRKNGVCKKFSIFMKPAAKFSGGYQVSGGASDCDWCDKQAVNETRVMEHLARAGPVTIAINSNGPLENYKKGIMDPWKISCLGYMPFLDHQIAIVGYGEEDGKKYWKLRNSWGTDWGEKGYGRMIRGSNMCGVVSDATHVMA